MPGLRRSERARAGRRAGAGRARRQSHRPHVHRRWRRRLGRLPDGGDARQRLRQPADVARHRTMGSSCRTPTSPRRSRCAPPDNKPTPEEFGALPTAPRGRVGRAAERSRRRLPRQASPMTSAGEILDARGHRAAEAAAGVCSRQRTYRLAGGPSVMRRLSPEPPEHEHGPVDAADARPSVRHARDCA